MVNAADSCSLTGILLFEERMMVWKVSTLGKDRKISPSETKSATTMSTEPAREKSHPSRTYLAEPDSNPG